MDKWPKPYFAVIEQRGGVQQDLEEDDAGLQGDRQFHVFVYSRLIALLEAH
ncbi:MAG: hypothetical protein ACYC99_00410 [Candidatus Geothermincolia bacterium]